MRRDGAGGGGGTLHLLTSSRTESWQWYKAAERNPSICYSKAEDPRLNIGEPGKQGLS